MMPEGGYLHPTPPKKEDWAVIYVILGQNIDLKFLKTPQNYI